MIADRNVREMNVQALVQHFAQVAERLSEVNFELVSPMDMPGRDNFVRESEQLYAELTLVDAELRSRGREARLALLELFDSPTLEVRLQAAVCSLGVAPTAARAQLEQIAATGWMEAISAQGTLKALDKGTFKPD
ncbi:MAG TPA: DUF2019 domain-containing protein [Stellaceae bacterium]|nr:DUF2019 domain-containing protein [Stellaceae bacterium]